jgi:hypothetical protein
VASSFVRWIKASNDSGWVSANNGVWWNVLDTELAKSSRRDEILQKVEDARLRTWIVNAPS